MPLSRIGGGSILNRLNPALPPGSVVNAIQLNPAAPPVPPAVGLFYWNDIDKTINVVPDLSGTVIQMGQELVIRVKNNTGAQINDGQVCYLNGVDAGRPTVDLARADVAGTSLATIGLATQNIAIGAEGFITKSGTVRNIDTGSCTPAALIYLSPTVAGRFTETRPLLQA